MRKNGIFSSWQADVVVINLGTNDGGYIWQNHLTDRDFETAVKEFPPYSQKKIPPQQKSYGHTE